jgi:hypothetical protein
MKGMGAEYEEGIREGESVCVVEFMVFAGHVTEVSRVWNPSLWSWYESL